MKVEKKFSNGKENEFMNIAAKITDDELIYSKGLQEYLKMLQKQKNDDPEEAKKDAIKALKKTGVINKNGTPKKKIVSWE